MFKKGILFLLVIIGVFSSEMSFASKRKYSKHSTRQVASYRNHKTTKHKKTLASHRGRKSKLRHKTASDFIATNQNLEVEKTNNGPKQMIALNTEKARITDSLNKSTIISGGTKENEGYFASLFASKNRASSFQTLEGTAAVFKSISGWDDKKFYVLTNLLPVGTIVRITTPDLKSICAKVINALPEVGNSVQYRLNDAAAAILGINNKTFPVSVTY